MTGAPERIQAGGVPPTVIDLLQFRAKSHPDDRAYTFLDGQGRESDSLGYGRLDEQSRAIAGMLQQSGLAGKRLMLIYGPGLDFVRGFFGCLYAGATAIPLAPARPRRGLNRLEAVASDTAPAAVLSTTALLSKGQTMCAESATLSQLPWLASDAAFDTVAADWSPPRVERSSLAYLQYTSGSTGSPRGVMITHANIMQNLAELRAGWPSDAQSVYVS